MCKIGFKLVQILDRKIYDFSDEVVIKQSECGEASPTSVLADSDFSANGEYSPV